MAVETLLPVRDYDLGATLTSGQAFRWTRAADGWAGVIGGRWVWLRGGGGGIEARTALPQRDWDWLASYLQTDLDLPAVLAKFPDDPPMRASVEACRGLRLLRQDPWECLASFILSSTKQIVQIRQIIGELCARFGDPVPTPAGVVAMRAFPEAARLAAATESELRDCRMGFRAPYLLETARRVAHAGMDLEGLRACELPEARARLMELPGVGAKIADCVLLFAYGFPGAFPVDVWVQRALRELYFPARRPAAKRLRHFAATHFGPEAGYAQQYLFHYMRTRRGRTG